MIDTSAGMKSALRSLAWPIFADSGLPLYGTARDRLSRRQTYEGHNLSNLITFFKYVDVGQDSRDGSLTNAGD
jgi:hypothetical protein